ncbi:hypothetical protein ACLKA6_015899 [Drosophila palustris]
MYDPENILLSCNIFRELCKYMRGEHNAERELQSIQYIIGLGIEREELRDEIFVQCMRQMTKNPNAEWADRLWLLMCLIIVAFQPSKLLFRFFVSFLKQKLESLDGKLRQYAQWCFDNCKCTKVSTRLQSPSSVEVAAMRRLGTIDPVEVGMLYAQAVHSVVKCDDFPVSEKVALQLAGLQAQVALGDPSNQPKPEYYYETIMIQIFDSILQFSGLGTSGEAVNRAEDEHIRIVQSILDKCMRKDSLLNELYLQLIKQTTDHPDANSRKENMPDLLKSVFLELKEQDVDNGLQAVKRFYVRPIADHVIQGSTSWMGNTTLLSFSPAQLLMMSSK